MNNDKEKTIHDNCVENKPFMNMSRRRFCQLAGATVAAVALGRYIGFDPASPAAAALTISSDPIPKFTQRLRNPLTGGIPLAAPDTVNPGWWQPGVEHYTIDIGPFQDRLHPSLPSAGTRLWGYGQGYSSANPNWTSHLGGIIVATKGTPVQITFRNHLPRNHILPVDDTIMGVMGNQYNRADVHLHGGLVPWVSDGGPHAWWDPDNHQGPSFMNNSVLHPGAPANEAEYYYPNNQSARLMWYHDHVFGLTRLNAYAGMATAYIITDSYETNMAKTVTNPDFPITPVNLPGPTDMRTLYLVFQDKTFVRSDITSSDSTWSLAVSGSNAGDLWYPHEYDPALVPTTGTYLPLPAISAIPEFFGDTILVNGSVYPYEDVQPREYRLRMLNACQARFLNPRLYYAKSNVVGSVDSTIPDLSRPGPGFTQIGTEGGFLPAPVAVNGTSGLQFLQAPAERADLIMNLTGVAPDSILILYNDAATPYPMGATPTNNGLGSGPDSSTLLQFRVGAAPTIADPPIALPSVFTPTDPFVWDQATPIVVSPDSASATVTLLGTPSTTTVPIRRLTLNETVDAHGRLIQYLGTDTTVGGVLGREYMTAPTEVVNAGATEVWEILNLTGDVHPMHFHLVNVQVLSRQAFDDVNYTGGIPNYIGSLKAPDANELGWKETVRMNPGEVTRVIMKFDLAPANIPSITIPQSPRTGGLEYVWHCHILEHEEHDMMRPLIVLRPGDSLVTGGSGSIPEFPSMALPLAGTIAALALAGKMKDKKKEQDTE